MQAEGGIVFYVDGTGEHGLVAAVEDLSVGSIDPMIMAIMDMNGVAMNHK